MTNASSRGSGDLSELRSETTHQCTTYDIDRRHKTVSVPRGSRVVVDDVRGQGHISQMWLTFPGWFWQHWNPQNPISQTILKTLILHIYWDDAVKPAVSVPVGDFFGVGLCEVANFAGEYFGMSSGGFYSKFPMPFRKGFRIEIENRDEAIDTELFCNVLYQLTDSVPETSAYFHCQFRTARLNGPERVPIAEARGHGHFVGCSVAMQGKEQNYLSFLEAPEYVYLDDDWDRPRITGTGLEDYFLGGWYFREGTFTGPLHGVPVKRTLAASVAMYRVHEADAIRFSRRLRFDFVNPWESDRLKPFAYSSAAYLYLDVPEGQGHAVPSREELLCWYRITDCDHQSVP
jgi:hypothetical protein